MIYIDRKFLLLISSRLRNFKQKKEDLYNFSCPYCGDSQRSSVKARGYVYRKGDNYFYRCHNCNVSTNFNRFLEFVDTESHKDYVVEKFQANTQCDIVVPEIPKARNIFKTMASVTIPNMNQLAEMQLYYMNKAIKARQYIINRKIPQEFYSEIFYAAKFKDFLDDFYPYHGKENVPNDARIVTFYTSMDGCITNVSGRALDNDSLRYVSVKITNDKKVFGLHRMDKTKHVYVLEGQFDSMFLPNAVASGDSNLIGLAEYLRRDCKVSILDMTLVFDNQPRNREIVKQIEAAVDDGYDIVLMKPEFPAKDINDMVLAGFTDIHKIVDMCRHQGLRARLELNNWRKC